MVRIYCASTTSPSIIHCRERIRPSTGGSGFESTGGVPKTSLTPDEINALNNLQMHLDSLGISGTIVNIELIEDLRLNQHTLHFKAPAINMRYLITFIKDKEAYISETNIQLNSTIKSGPYTLENLYNFILRESVNW